MQPVRFDIRRFLDYPEERFVSWSIELKKDFIKLTLSQNRFRFLFAPLLN